jgi:hypothetical protein
VEVNWGIYKSSYHVSNTLYLNSRPPPFSFTPHPLPHSWDSFNRYHFSIYIHVYTVFASYSLSHTLSSPLPSSQWYQSTQEGHFTPPILDFVKETKKRHLSLFKIATQEISLWYFHTHMHYNLNWFIHRFFSKWNG